jgi:hypothetical protein
VYALKRSSSSKPKTYIPAPWYPTSSRRSTIKKWHPTCGDHNQRKVTRWHPTCGDHNQRKVMRWHPKPKARRSYKRTLIHCTGDYVDSVGRWWVGEYFQFITSIKSGSSRPQLRNIRQTYFAEFCLPFLFYFQQTSSLLCGPLKPDNFCRILSNYWVFWRSVFLLRSDCHVVKWVYVCMARVSSDWIKMLILFSNFSNIVSLGILRVYGG